MSEEKDYIFDKLLSGGIIALNDPEMLKAWAVPANTIVGGVPAKFIRKIEDEEIIEKG